MNRVAMKLNIFFTALVLIFILVITAEAVKGDKRESKTFSLGNGLDILLISDPDVHRSAAALSVGVGHLHDPKEKQGLAHYLEHMLFLGTKKYPEVGSFKKFLDEHSGGSNAYTSGAITNYFFQISHEGFDIALDRFSDFFKAPLFDKTYSEREVKAVNNEHQKNKLNDGWRGSFVSKQISEPGHPLTMFGTGNQDTLSGDNRPALLDFYEKYYSASNMKLALISNIPMQNLFGIAKKYFSGIPSREVNIPSMPKVFRRPLKNQFRLLKIKTIKDIRSLEVDFPTIRLNDYQNSKPAGIISSLIGHEGKGSLLSKLKEEGLVLSLSAGGGSSHPDINSFGISVSLTPKGLENYERILELIFNYIRMIRDHGVDEYTFKENQTMAQINFDWKNPDEGMGFVAAKAALLHDYSLENVETLPFLLTKYNPDAYKALLDTLVLENALVVLSHKNAVTDKTAPYYDAEYSLELVGGKIFEKLKRDSKIPGIFYQAKNDFIPHNLKLLEDAPHLIRQDDVAKVWFMYDHKFKQPKVALMFQIETPKVYRSPKNLELANLYGSAVKEGLNELVYPIQEAGLSYSLSTNKKGVVLTLGGYSERIGDLIKLVTKNLTNVNIDEQKFNNFKEAMIRGLKNKKLNQAYQRGGYYNWLMMLDNQYTDEEKLEALSPLTLNDVKSFAKKLYEKVYVTGVIHGNWTDKQAKESVSILLDSLNGKSLPIDERYEQIVEVLNPGEQIQFSQEVQDNNNSLSYTIQVGEKDLALMAKASIIASIVENDFYTQMRTNQQLGYIVWSFQQRTEKRMFFRFLIQSSTHGPFEMSKRVRAWLKTTDRMFANLSDEEFEKHRQAKIIALEKEGDSIGAVVGDLYTLATDEEGDFQFKKKLIKAIKDLNKNDVSEKARELFLDPQTPRLEVLMRAKGSKESVPASAITSVAEFKNRVKG
ncbi:MAG: insulinase family protein [Nitrospinales bacterium]|nr:insulinase family protein [Nitrospinales bacterium]